MSVRLRHLVAVATVALATAPVAAPAGGDLRSPDTRDRASAIASSRQDLRSPDTRDRAAAIASSPRDLRSPDVRDYADAARSAGVVRGDQPGRDIALIRAFTPPQVVVSTEAFDWADALAGAAGAVGLIAVALGIVALGGRLRRTQPST